MRVRILSLAVLINRLWAFYQNKCTKSLRISLATCMRPSKELRPVKWSLKFGQEAKVYPEPVGGIRDGETPEVHRSVQSAGRA